MNVLATALLVLCFGLLTAGAALIFPAAGLLTAGVLTGVAGAMCLTVQPKKDEKPR